MADFQSACLRLKIAFYLLFEMRCANISNSADAVNIEKALSFNFISQDMNESCARITNPPIAVRDFKSRTVGVV